MGAEKEPVKIANFTDKEAAETTIEKIRVPDSEAISVNVDKKAGARLIRGGSEALKNVTGQDRFSANWNKKETVQSPKLSGGEKVQLTRDGVNVRNPETGAFDRKIGKNDVIQVDANADTVRVNGVNFVKVSIGEDKKPVYVAENFLKKTEEPTKQLVTFQTLTEANLSSEKDIRTALLRSGNNIHTINTNGVITFQRRTAAGTLTVNDVSEETADKARKQTTEGIKNALSDNILNTLRDSSLSMETELFGDKGLYGNFNFPSGNNNLKYTADGASVVFNPKTFQFSLMANNGDTVTYRPKEENIKGTAISTYLNQQKGKKSSSSNDQIASL